MNINSKRKVKGQIMSNNKISLLFFSMILFAVMNLSTASNKIFAQDNQGDDDVILDSIDTKENLLDSNTVYQKDFDSLSSKGDWVKIDRSELIKDVSGNSDEIVEDDDPAVVKIIYVWRPRYADYDWNPYCNGRWVFTWRGWIWESDYDWGWACYNYGRWYWSGAYGWCWLPGRVWAPNWCIWRTHGNYCGWYPTCPRIHWRHHGHWVRNHTFRSKTKNWVFVDKKDFTKKIDKNLIVKNEKNNEILKSSEKIKNVNTYVTDKKTIKYNGPEVTNISKESGEKITPKKVSITKVPNSVVIKDPNNVRIPKDGTTRTPRTTRETTRTRSEGNYNPPTPRTEGPRNHGSHNNGTRGNQNPPKGSGPSKNNGNSGPSKNNGSKSNGNSKK